MAPPTNARTRRTGRRIVVVGGGMAAARLVQQLAAGHGGVHPGGSADHATEVAPDVTVIGEEQHPPYNRVLLAEVLAGQYAPGVVELPAPPSAARWLRGVRAVRLDRAAGEVSCDDGRHVPYDTLVLATGSNPVLPPLRGLFEPDGGELPLGVHAFRTMDDCLALAGAVRPGVRAVVIGGGLLGVSAARALARRGAQVVLAHQGEYLMERQLDEGAARLLRQHLAELDVEVHTECRVRGLLTRSGAQRAVSAVELADGYRLDADLVVLACGVRPRVGLARAAGLDVARGIVVDDALRTSDPRIHAIGDCAEHDGTVYGLAGPAQEQADVLARVLLAARGGAAHDGSAEAGAPQDITPGERGAAVTDSTVPGSSTVLGSAVPGSTCPGAAHTSAPHDGGSPSARPPRYTGTRALTRLTLASPAAPAAAPTNAPERTGDANAPASPTPRPLDLAAFGETTPAPGDDVVHLSDATRGAYRKVVVRGDRLVGGILLGDLGTVGALARTWEGDEPLPSAPLLHLLTHDGGP
ncbi:FAD-dependent oxidoreductase [Streptomyces sp. NPDC051776]|uniref:NAD(P)/FAD-dependent oxidoreductase n=1 Tax=Streptomyces sp. NPDC051776 TaxID=3155414 RepID=UPI0034187468